MRRTDLTGIPILDALDRGNVNGFYDGLFKFIGEYAGAFTVPGRTAMDIIGQFSEQERLPRDARSSPLLGPTLQNIPFAERYLPVRPSPFRASPEQKINPLLRQLTGLNYREKTPVEIEADRLGLKFQEIYPNTGIKAYDRLIVEYMGSQLEKTMGNLISQDGYLRLDNDLKKKVFKKEIGEFRKAGEAIQLNKLTPHEQIEQLAKNKDKMVREALEKKFLNE